MSVISSFSIEKINIHEKNLNNCSAVIYACGNGYLEHLILLLEHGANINDLGIWDIDCLTAAISNKKQKIVTFLVKEKGFKVNENHKSMANRLKINLD